MHSRTYLLKSLVPLGLVGFIAGCTTAPQTIRQEAPQAAQPALPDRQEEARHDLALRRFVDASVHDLNNEYAEAILDYQEALQYEPVAAIYYAISRDFSLLGKPAQAAEAGRKAISMEPGNITYHENLATVYLNAFQPDLAIGEYESIVHLDSNYQNGWFNLARLYQPTKPLKALEIYEKLLDRNGDEWDLLLQSAEIYNSLGRFNEAADHYRRMLEIDPSNKALRRQLAETYSKAGEPQKAIEMLESMLELDQEDLEATATLADVYLDQKEFGKAIALYEKLLQSDKSNPELRLRVGVAYFGQLQRDSTLTPKAVQILEAVRRDIPNDWRPYWYLSAIAANQKEDSLSQYYMAQVTKLAGWNADAWWYLGSSLFDKGEYAKLLETMDRAEKSLPKQDYRVYLLMGLAYSRLEQPQQAVSALKKAYALNPKDINTISSLALEYDGMQQFADSDSLYEEALRIDPQNALVLNNYGYSLGERGLQLERALDMAQRAVAAEPDNAAYLDTLGWIFFKLSRFTEAQQYIAKAVDTGKASAVVVEHLGDIFSKLGNREKAVELWQKALGMNGGNQALKDKIGRGTL